MNHNECGQRYKLTIQQKRNLPTKLLSIINGPNTVYLDKCLAKRENIVTGTDRIVGGVGAKPGDHPWLVSFLLPRSSYHQPCTGSLINRCWVMSAAQCFDESSVKRHYVVRVGEFHRGSGQGLNSVQSIHESKIERVMKWALKLLSIDSNCLRFVYTFV